jgi:hypothetical protein
MLIFHEKFFPVLILVLYALASARYAVARNWPQALYWVCAWGLTFLVSFVIPLRR